MEEVSTPLIKCSEIYVNDLYYVIRTFCLGLCCVEEPLGKLGFVKIITIVWAARGPNPGRDKRFFSSPKCQGQFWGSLNQQFSGCQDFFMGVKKQRC